ncbi:hypothetical protein MTO96_021727 [Rhipicephalus appendiculatus]
MDLSVPKRAATPPGSSATPQRPLPVPAMVHHVPGSPPAFSASDTAPAAIPESPGDRERLITGCVLARQCAAVASEANHPVSARSAMIVSRAAKSARRELQVMARRSAICARLPRL